MPAAYLPYRAALFCTDGKARLESEQASDQAQLASKAIAERYGSKPPVPYRRKGQFAATAAFVKATAELPWRALG